MPKLNATPEEAMRIHKEADDCQTGLDSFDEARWCAFMAVFGCAPGKHYELIVRFDLEKIPAPGVPRLEE